MARRAFYGGDSRQPEAAPKYIRLRVLTLRAKGLSWRKIEEKTGVNMSTCRKWVAKHSNDAEEKKES